jgi:hypothetical protein
MSRFKETEKPFEKFLRIFLYVWLTIALTVGFLVFIGVIKTPGKVPPRQATTPAELPEHLEPRPPNVLLRNN